MKIDTLEKLFVHELKDVYNAEKQIEKALPKMAKAAHNEELRSAFEEHLQQTRDQIKRLEKVFDIMNMNPRSEHCAGMEGIVEECKDLLDQDVEPDVLDAGLIACAQKVEHYEIASYGTIREYAQELGHDDAAKLLGETLSEEEETDRKLTKLATSAVNQKAIHE